MADSDSGMDGRTCPIKSRPDISEICLHRILLCKGEYLLYGIVKRC